jgi:hypothetical protein
VTGHYTLMSCNGLEWIQPPSNQSRIPGSYGYYDPPLAIVNELNRLVDRIKRLEEAGDEMCSEFKAFCPLGSKTRDKWRKAKEANP